MTILPSELATNLTHHAGLLRRRFPGLARLLESSRSALPDSVVLETARNGLPTAAVQRSAGLFYIHSRYDPLTEAQRWVDEINSHEADFVVVVGMGLGFHLERLIDGRPLRRLVVIEPEPDVFVVAMAARDQSQWLSHPRLDLIVLRDPKVAATWLFQRYQKQLLRQPRVALWPATSRYAPDFWPTLHGQLLDLLRAERVNVATNRTFSARWVENFFANLDAFAHDPDVVSIFEAFRGRPGIIVAAGPSLERNGHLLQQARGRAVIIGAGSAINPLLRHGVEPDLLVSLDAGEANYRHFENLNSPISPLVYVPTIYPRIVEEYAGPRFTATLDTFPFIKWFAEALGKTMGVVASGPSVANVAWDLALQMGLDPIILVGQDLAYTYGKSHAEGAAHARAVPVKPEEVGYRYFEVEAVDGGTVLTDRVMYAMKVWFEQRLAFAPDGHVTIDATEGGARIIGTQVLTLQEALATYCREVFAPQQTIIEIHKHERERIRASGIGTRLHSVLHELEFDLASVGNLSDIGLRDGRQLLVESRTKRLTEKRYHDALKRFRRLVDELSRLDAYDVIVKPLIPHILESITLSIQARWEAQVALHDKGRELGRQYLVLFGNAKQTSKRIQRLVRTQLTGSRSSQVEKSTQAKS